MFRDRIKELRRVRAGDLKPHPLNWRTHPDRQRRLLKRFLKRLGYADALLARELPDGSLQLIDGHLRAEITPDSMVPVLVLDLDENEARELLLLLDPLSAMAEADTLKLETLLERTRFEEPILDAYLEELRRSVQQTMETSNTPLESVPESYQVIVLCQNEEEQKTVYRNLTAQGLRCRLLIL